MGRRSQRDAQNSAAMRQMAGRPSRLGFARTQELLAKLTPVNVDRVCHLGNRIVGYNSGQRFELSC